MQNARLVMAWGLLLVVAGGTACEPVPYPQSVPVGVPPPVYEPLTVHSGDGTRLHVHEWAPAKVAACAPVVVFIHGIGMHGGAYGSIAPAFTAKGIIFLAPDLRGHGRSGGDHGVLASPSVMHDDLAVVLAASSRRYPGSPVFLAGESMGGLLAADYVVHAEKPVAGLILLAPAFRVPLIRRPVMGGGSDPHAHPVLAGIRQVVRALRTGSVELDGADKLGASTRDAGFGDARPSDPFALHRVSLHYLLTLGSMQSEWPGAADRLRLPLCIVVAGRDNITDNATTQLVLRRAHTPEGDKAWRNWREAFHTLCWDPVTPQCMDGLARWVLAETERVGRAR